MKRYTKTISAVLALALLAAVSESPARAAGKSPADTVNVPAKAGHRVRQTLVLPYGNNYNKSLSTGGSSVFYEEDINKYPSSDFRNALTGVVPGLFITEINGMTGLMSDGMRGGMNFRGMTPKFVVDGQPVYLSEIQIDPEEIESMTFVKDVLDKALFGSRSSEGVIYITTKRGLPAGKTIKVGMESGVSVVDRMPGYVGGAEYATLQNQAREAAGYPLVYTADDIQAYSLNRPDDLIHPSVDWRGLMFKDTKSYKKANLTVQGGTEAVKYAVYFGYLGEGDFYAAGPSAGFNKINVRANAEMKITSDLRFNVGLFSGLNFRRSPHYGYGGSGTFNEFDNYLVLASTTPPTAFPVHVGLNTETGGWIYGVNENYTANPYATLAENGFFTERERSGIINGTLTWDMNKIAKGLRFESYVGLNVFNMDRIGKNPDYIAVIYDKETGTSVKTSHEGAKASGKSAFGKWYHQSLYLNERLSYVRDWGWNRLSAAAVYYLETTERSSSAYRDRQQSVILNADYSYANRYLAQIVMNTTGSCMFMKGKRYGVFPSLGLGWVVSEEDFLKGSGQVDYLKLRAQAGVIGYNPFGALDLYEDEYLKEKGVNFGPASTDFEWIGGSTKYQSYKTTLLRLGNKDLTWEKRKEITAGIEAKFFGNRLSVDADYFYILRDGIITNTSDVNPKLFGFNGVATYDNYNKIRYQGAEVALNWTDKIGDFEYSIGGWAIYNRGKYLRYSESQINDYNKVEGSMAGDYHGYVYLGKYASAEDIASSPEQTFDSEVQAGDLKYKDLNGDGKIDYGKGTLDNHGDLERIGNQSPRYYFGINLGANWNGIGVSVFLQGVGKRDWYPSCESGFFWGMYNRPYGYLPKIHTQDAVEVDYSTSNWVVTNAASKPYFTRQVAYAANRNDGPLTFENDYYMQNAAYVRLKNLTVDYTFPSKLTKKIRVEKLKVYFSGENLLTFSPIYKHTKMFDPETLGFGDSDFGDNVGGLSGVGQGYTYPMLKTYTFGLNITF